MTRPSWHAAGVEGRAYGVGSSHARAFQRPSIHRATRDTRDERPTRCISDWPMTFTDAQLIGWLQQFIWPLARVSSALLIVPVLGRSEEHTSELQSLMRISYAVFCLTKKKKNDANQPA